MKIQETGNDYIESAIAGIPCLIGIDTAYYIKPWQGSAQSCPSADDYYGGWEIEFSVYDRKGYSAGWLESKMKRDDVELIESEIVEYYKNG